LTEGPVAVVAERLIEYWTNCIGRVGVLLYFSAVY
jgi:hypothetical protein